MSTSESYAELVSRTYSQSRQDGNRSFPVASYEIFMLSQAQERAKDKEATLFRQLGDIFDWNITRRQRDGYLHSLNTGYTLILTDLSKTILWTSHNFLAMTGYGYSEVVGQTPKLLQGPATDPAAVLLIRESLQRARPVETAMINYRKNGEPYRCHVTIDPLRNSQGELTHFLAVENEIDR